jgi:FxsC-like protein
MSPADSYDRCHFFLSYAHSEPLTNGGRRDTDTDHWVSRCYDDLSAEVARLLGADPQRVGFVDYLAPTGADWKDVLTEKLGVAQVFVPLYSPGYFNKSWPIRERAAFLRRLDTVFPGTPDKARAHVIPVLWTPFPNWDRIPELNAAMSLGAGVAEYAENGLRALCKLRSFNDSYRKILGRLAQRIVDTTSHAELPRGRPVRIEDMPTREAPTTETPFVVGLIGTTKPHWRPFGAAQDPPIAEYVANVAERLGLPAKIVDPVLELKAVDNSPSVLVVDPWVLARTSGEETLGRLAGHLHPWVTPIVVTDRHEARYSGSGAEVVQRAADRLTALGAHRVYTAVDVEQVARLIPSAVSETRRQYLRHGSVRVPRGSQRPRLGDDVTAPPVGGEGGDD